MKMLMRVYMDAIKGTEAIQSGAFLKAMGGIIDSIKPEAVYYLSENGKRAAYIVFDMKRTSQLVEIGEPLFALGAEMYMTPCMSPDDATAGFAALRE